MEVFAEGSYPTDAPAAAVSVGVYDGVHLGHRHVLGRLRAHAATKGFESLVLTFDPHPASVVDPARAPALLSTLDRRLELLADAGIDRCVVMHFGAAQAEESAESFVARVLVGTLHASVVVVGENFRFGHDRAGDVSLLGQSERRGEFAVEPVALGSAGGTAITSSRIRGLVAAGDVAAAAALLGRPHELEGVVVHGDGRGRTIGFPTANLEVEPRLCRPALGIYAGTWTRPGGERYAAAISVGRRPTFHDGADVLVEAYLCDADVDLYGERGRLSFVERLRDEERFESADALAKQIALDVEATRSAVGC